MSKNNYNIEVLKDNPGESDLSFKLIIIGDAGVGKSSLSIKATKNIFDPIYSPTIGFEFSSFFIKIEDLIIKLQIWDTCGQEVYRSVIKSFYRYSSLAILVYSIENKKSFENLGLWLNEIRTEGNTDINIFLIGNKVDLEDKREVQKELAQSFMNNNHIKLFLETSAKTGFNAENVFIEAGRLLYDQHMEYKNRISRPQSLANLLERNSEESNNTKIFKDEDDYSNNKNRKKKCC